MKGTRDRIVDLLRRHGELPVARLAQELEIAPPALRRHLEILTGEGLVEHRAVKQQTGRPYFAYRLTEQAKEPPAAGYARLLERLIQDAAAMPAGDGQRVLLEALFDRLSQHLAEDYRGRVWGDTIEERVRSLIDAMREEGILDGWEQRRDGSIVLFNTTCPHRRAALAASELCDSERRAISALLGEDVQQTGRMVEGAACCEYVVRPAESAQLLVLQP